MAKKKPAKKKADPNEYTITDKTGTHRFRLSPPASVAQRYSIISSADGNQLFALSAALGACWRGPGRPKTKISTHKFDFNRYGQAVFDELHGRGVDVEVLMSVATAAFVLCLDGIMSGDEVKAFADFTGAQSGG